MQHRRDLRSAGPGHATKPPPPRNSRLASRFSSAWRSCSLPTNSTSCATSLRADRNLNPVDVNIPSTCNAYWDGVGVNFFHAGGGCANTGTIADVVFLGMYTQFHVETDLGALRVEVEDDGAGFDPLEARHFLRMGKVGLASMRERAELGGGTLVVQSRPGAGTIITATLPFEILAAAPRPR